MSPKIHERKGGRDDWWSSFSCKAKSIQKVFLGIPKDFWMACINNFYALAKNSYEEMQSNMKTGPKIVSLSGLYFVAKFQKGGGYRYEINRCVSVVFTLVMPTLHSVLGWSQKRQKIMLIPFIIPSKCHVQGGLGLSS